MSEPSLVCERRRLSNFFYEDANVGICILKLFRTLSFTPKQFTNLQNCISLLNLNDVQVSRLTGVFRLQVKDSKSPLNAQEVKRENVGRSQLLARVEVSYNFFFQTPIIDVKKQRFRLKIKMIVQSVESGILRPEITITNISDVFTSRPNSSSNLRTTYLYTVLESWLAFTCTCLCDGAVDIVSSVVGYTGQLPSRQRRE